jgi:hypothetical protein
VGRLLFWLVSATVALTFLWPKASDGVIRRYSSPWPAFAAPADPAFARWRTWSMLGALNLLFFWANSLDAVFLWLHTQLPAGVTYSGFVHEGVFALTTATLLSAATLTLLLQQDGAVSGHPATRALAYAWIAQNLLLIASVALRLELYVEAYSLTVARCGVWCFLGLVALGFVLLARRIARNDSLNRLILSNGAAVVALFFVVQFVDLSGLVARYNTDRWLAHRTATVDVRYLQSLGPPAWPSLVRIYREGGSTPERAAARRALQTAAGRSAQPRSWQSWQWREDRLRKEVFPNPGAGVRQYP